MTGPSHGGIGAETAVTLAAAAPAMIILVGRSRAKAQPTMDAIRAVDGSVRVKFFEAELASLASVRRAADAVLADRDIARIDVVINNAGVMALPLARTEDGLEMQLAANHLGHFVLTNRLMPRILAGGVDGSGPRIVLVSSCAHRYNGVRFEDPNYLEPGSYSEFGAYGSSKSAVILYAVALNRRLARRGAAAGRAYSLHPGSVRTGLQSHVTALEADRAAAIFDEASLRVHGVTLAESRALSEPQTLQQGCATQLRAALDPGLEEQKGVYLENAQLTTDPQFIREWATDAELAERCWALSEKLVGEKFDI